MTSGQLGGLIGGITGGVLGALGGAIGTYFSIRNARPGRERAYMVRCAIICWIAVTIFVALLFLLPSPYRFILWIPYGVLLPVGIIKGNKGIARIRAEEAQNDEKDLVDVVDKNGPADN